MSPVLSCRRLAVAGIATLAAVATTAAPAMAGEQAAGCPAAALSNPFSPWADGADYQLAPGGDIEDAGGTWALSGGAEAQEGNETFAVGGSADHLSLSLPEASSATTDRMCIGVEHTSFRFFVRRSGGRASSRLAVEVVVDRANGRERTVTAGVITGSADWAPSPQLPMIVNRLAKHSDNAMDVSLRFQPIGDGPAGDAVWSIDDVFVDPYRTH
jgi:hypothetical protein